MAQAYGDLYSPKDIPAEGPVGGATVVEETDAAESPKQPQKPTINVESSSEQISPEPLRHKDHEHGQHVHFNVQIDETDKGLIDHCMIQNQLPEHL